MCRICLELTLKTIEQRLIITFEEVSHIALVFPLLTLNKQMRFVNKGSYRLLKMCYAEITLAFGGWSFLKNIVVNWSWSIVFRLKAL